MSDEVQQSKLLAVFDFDHTLVDGNTDTWVTKLLPSTMQLIREHHEKGWCWTNVMDKVFGVLHAENLTKEDYEKCFETLQFTEGMKEACNFLQTRKMSPVIFSLLVLLAVFLSGVDGINGTVSPGVGNSSSVDVNLSTTAVPTTQITTDLPTNATPQNATPGIKIGECHGFEVFILNSQLNIPYTVTCCIAVLCGFYLILFGYRFFKSSLFLLGFLFATFVTYIIGSNHADLPSWGLVAVAVAVGIFCGLLTMFVTYCGLFLGGFGLGFFIGIAIFFIVETFYHVSIKWIPFGVLLGLSLIFSLLTLRWQKGFFIVATSIIGAALITVGVDYFIEEFVLINYAWQRIMAGDEKVDCWVSWVLLAVWPVMFILGNVVQFCKTGRSYTHRKRSDSVSLQGEDKAMKRYRSLNMNGDVVAKSYYTKDEDERRPTEV